MNKKEIAEIRRRFNSEKSNITSVCGCYVNSKKEIVAEFSESLSLMPDEERDQVFSRLRHVLSGSPDRNLYDISISTQQVMSGEEHRLLSKLRTDGLGDAEAVGRLYRSIISAVSFDDGFLIFLAHDTYDVPYRSRDGAEDAQDSENLFRYIICAVCPVATTKPTLGFHLGEHRLRNIATDWVIRQPEIGFMFPAFDSRAANIYGALYYTRDAAADHSAFIDAVFRAKTPMPAAAQKETFQSVLGEAIADDCSLDVVQAVRGQLGDIAATYKETRSPDPLRFTKETVEDVLKSCGVSDERVDVFSQKYSEEFGSSAEISAAAVLDSRPIEIDTPDVVIRVNPERGDLVDTRIIDGARYILIRAEENVKVSGITIHINE